MSESTVEAPDALFSSERERELAPCSFNECIAGHRWKPVIADAECPGCASPILAIQKTLCPYCNEPIARTLLRTDSVPRGSGVAKRCRGQEVAGDTLTLEMVPVKWQEVQAAPPENFEDRRAAERTEAGKTDVD